MLRRVLLLAVTACLGTTLAAQAPAGWKVRIDRSQNAQDPDNTPNLKFMRMGNGFHATGGPAGTFWNPSQTAMGNYTAKATFTLLKPSGHTNYYGLVFGGDALDGANQAYNYFIVAQDGTYQIRSRTGDQVQTVQAKTAHDAVKRPGDDGRSVNALEVRVAGDTVSYVINGTVVHTTPKSALGKTDGIVGVRINHLLDVQVEGFQVQKG